MEKSAMFFETFFPKKPMATSVPDDYEYPPPKWKFTNITNAQIYRSIRKMKPYKATMRGTVPNSFLINMSNILVPHLGPLFQATNTLKHYPIDWALTQTLVMKKLGKPNYTVPGAWRPIVLSNGFACLLNSCQTEDMVTMCEKLDILPNNHFGGRPGRTTTDALHLMTKTVKDAWRRKEVASILFLDVKGAFPSVAVDRLIHNMHTKGIPKQYTEWMQRRLVDCQTTLLFDDHQSEKFSIDNGLDQGDPYSVICYLLYNTSLLEIPTPHLREAILLFVDDATIIVAGKNFEDTHRMLRSIMERRGGVFDWAKEHNCKFGVEKFQLLDLTKRMIGHMFVAHRMVPMPRANLRLRTHIIKSQTSAKFLGVIVNNTLSWKEQAAAALGKGHDWVLQFGRLAQPTKGVSRANMRRFYLSIAVPRMLYAADIFLTPPTNRSPADLQRNGRAVINKLASVQRRAALSITGGMQSAPTDVLDVLADILPFHLLVKQHRKQAALHLATLPETHPLSKPVMSAARRFVKTHTTPLHHLMRELGRDPATLEMIEAVRQTNKWKAAFTMEIEEKREDAEVVELQDREDQAGVRVYTDGSGLGGEIGAAAVLYRGDMERGQLRYRLGTVEEHMVYEGECVGILLGLELIKQQQNMRKVTMYVDSQATIQATMSNKPAPGHYLLDEVHKQYGILQKIHGNMEMVIRWSPGHSGIPGNEAADKAAREAAEGQVTMLRQLPGLFRKELPHGKSAARQTDR